MFGIREISEEDDIGLLLFMFGDLLYVQFFFYISSL